MPNRAYESCSHRDTIHKEIMWLKQMLTNNNYHMSLLDRGVKSFCLQSTNLEFCLHMVTVPPNLQIYFTNVKCTATICRKKSILRKQFQIMSPPRRIYLSKYSFTTKIGSSATLLSKTIHSMIQGKFTSYTCIYLSHD